MKAAAIQEKQELLGCNLYKNHLMQAMDSKFKKMKQFEVGAQSSTGMGRFTES